MFKTTDKNRLTYRHRQLSVNKNKKLGAVSYSSKLMYLLLIPLGLGLIAGGLLFVGGNNPLTLFGFNAKGEPILEIELHSRPEGAQVVVDGTQSGNTPTRLKLPSGKSNLQLQKSGYSSYKALLEIKGQPSNGPNLPNYTKTIELWPDKVRIKPLPRPLPDLRVEYARYLNSTQLELTELDAQHNPLSPGLEGWPTNLWLYNFIGGLVNPIIVSSPTLKPIVEYYNSNQKDSTRLVLTNPTLSPEARRLAFVARPLKGNQPYKNEPAKPEQNLESVWLATLGATPSEVGNILTENSPLKLFNLGQLVELLPNLKLIISSPAFNQPAVRVEQLSWSPGGECFLLVLKSGGSAEINNLTILVLIGAGAGTAPGQATLVTPQPLPFTILPGSIKWNTEGTKVAFLTENTSYNSTKNPALCILNLNQGTTKKGPDTSGTNTPLLYLGEVGGGGVWGSSSNNYFNLSEERVYPASFGNIRYNPFAWQSPEAGYYASQTAIDQSGQMIDSIFSFQMGGGKIITKPVEPNKGINSSTKNYGTTKPNPQKSYPFWRDDSQLLYLSVSPYSRQNNSLSGTAQAFLLEVRSFLTPETLVNATSNITLVISPERSPLPLPFLDKSSRFEAQWRQDGKGLIVALASALAPELWLVEWD